jgi:ubiquinone/menaquinone biosynthesis C-methylase UbiE
VHECPDNDLESAEVNEADIQVLASIRRAEVEGKSTDRKTLINGADCYWKYLEDWSSSWQSLRDDGLIQGDASGYSLTERGRPLAQHYYAERPDYIWYYYQHYYPAAQASSAHSQLCKRVYGKDLVQDGQADIHSVHDLITYLEINQGDTVLDLGCGAGCIAEYIADHTGAHVTGLDNARTAIKTANVRTSQKRDRVTFVQGDINSLDFSDHSFDQVLLIDTVYWLADIDQALASTSRLIKPGGRMGIFLSNSPFMDNSPGAFEPHGTWVAKSLAKLNLKYEAHDYTESFLEFWPTMKKVALELKDEFIAEGNEVLFEIFMRDADEDYLPAIEQGKLRRFLYIVSV